MPTNLKIVEEEADETIYWLEAMEETSLLTDENILALKKEANEILSIIVASIKTMKSKIANNHKS